MATVYSCGQLGADRCKLLKCWCVIALIQLKRTGMAVLFLTGLRLEEVSLFAFIKQTLSIDDDIYEGCVVNS